MSLLARWRADQLVYEDTGGTDLVEDTDPVAAWKVYEGTLAGSLATQSTLARRPAYVANDGGHPALVAVNANKSSLTLAHSASWVLSEFSWLAAVKTTAEAGARHLWGRDNSWVRAACYIGGESASGVGGSLIYFHTSYQVRNASSTRPANSSSTWFVVGGTANGSEIKTFVNRQSVTRVGQTQTINLGTSGTTIFSDVDNTIFGLTGSLRELAFWNTALSETDMATEIDAAMTRWGITNTVTPPVSGSYNPFHAPFPFGAAP